MPKNILVIEDDLANSLLMRKILMDEDINVDVVSDAISAWEKLKTNRYDLFVVDLNLPFGKNGFEFLSRLRSLDEYKSVPVIAITAYIGIFTREDCLAKGFDYYFSKPFEIESFVKTVKKFLNKK
jgi:CheY-like chemotaxis protein